MKKKILILIAVIVLVIAAAYFYNSSISGFAVSATGCRDSDAGLDYYTPGYVIYRNFTFRDYCSGTRIYEQYCKKRPGNYRSISRYKCPYGCSLRACLTNQTTNTAS